MEYLENYDAICFSDQNSDPTFKWNTWRIMMPSAFPIRIPIGLFIGIQMPSALGILLSAILKGRKIKKKIFYVWGLSRLIWTETLP